MLTHKPKGSGVLNSWDKKQKMRKQDERVGKNSGIRQIWLCMSRIFFYLLARWSWKQILKLPIPPFEKNIWYQLIKLLRTKILTAHHILEYKLQTWKKNSYLCLVQIFFIVKIAMVLKEITTFRMVSLAVFLISKPSLLFGPHVYLFAIGNDSFYPGINHHPVLFCSFFSWLIIFVFSM